MEAAFSLVYREKAARDERAKVRSLRDPLLSIEKPEKSIDQEESVYDEWKVLDQPVDEIKEKSVE